ncbi:MAG: hypothetical protein CFE37_02540 [Alphaproteobacteria bacterium PA4]|nr:MAG: hypothetical protein CFE37_02540 [Alphaproteobacteria bacterium PA4]
MGTKIGTEIGLTGIAGCFVFVGLRSNISEALLRRGYLLKRVLYPFSAAALIGQLFSIWW